MPEFGELYCGNALDDHFRRHKAKRSGRQPTDSHVAVLGVARNVFVTGRHAHAAPGSEVDGIECLGAKFGPWSRGPARVRARASR